MNFCRDHARTPLAWSDADNGGFSKVKPWLRVSDSYRQINVAANLKDENSIWHYTQKAIAIRNNNKVLQTGTISFRNEQPDILSFTRALKGNSINIIINLGPKTRRLKQAITGNVVLNNYDSDSRVIIDKLSPYQAIIIAS